MPKDPALLLSVVNTKLRDEYGSLDELCATLGEEGPDIERILAQLDYWYDPQQNQFK